MLCNHEPAYALRLPNQMYFEFSTSICYEEIYRALSEILKDIILDMKKPLMYWKPDEWDLWKNRFKIIPNSFNCY